MKPAPFDYARPDTLDEALSLLAKHGENAKLIAGGQSLVPMMNLRLARPALLIDINGLKSLDYHRRVGDALHVGALARHATLAASSTVRELCPLVSQGYRYVAHGTVRNRGTLCGNLSHADPASEMPAIMLVLGASMVLRSSKAERVVEAGDFFKGIYTTAAMPQEMLVEVRIPVTASGSGYGFEELSPRKGDYALTLVAASMQLRAGKVETVAIAYAGVADRALRLAAVEKSLIGQAPSAKLFEEAAAAAAKAIDVSEDQHADRAYRRDLIRALTPRALARAAAAAGA